MSVYVGIDQSLSGFGLSILFDDDLRHDTRVKGFDPAKLGPGVTRYLKVAEWLDSVLQGFPTPNHIVMEGYANGAKFGREKAGELGATVKMALYDIYGPSSAAAYPTIIKPSSLKKFVTGKGAGQKNLMLLGVYKKWDEEFTNDNAADAYSCARVAMAIDKGPALAYEKDVLKTLTFHTEKFPR